jgi:hypothetical protein
MDSRLFREINLPPASSASQLSDSLAGRHADVPFHLFMV